MSVIDVDECEVLDGGCHQVCTNTEGSRNCSCDDGFELMTDGITCQGKNNNAMEQLRKYS